jgi:hypothetical protein
MAKKVIKDDKIYEILKNIAEDFRYSNELADIPLMFYKIEQERVIRGNDIDKVIEYCTTGLDKLNNPNEIASYYAENVGIDQTKLDRNLDIFRAEYQDLLRFLNS